MKKVLVFLAEFNFAACVLGWGDGYFKLTLLHGTT